MNNKKALMLGAAVVTLSVPAAQKAANAALDQLNINAEIVRAIVVTETQALDFGTVAAHTLAGTVVVDVAGGVASETNANALGAVARGQLNLQAATGFPIDISLSATKVSITWTAGGTGTAGDKMVVDQFEISAAGAAPAVFTGAAYVVTLAATNDQINVGARLNVGASQATGNYTGTVDVSANYQ